MKLSLNLPLSVSWEDGTLTFLDQTRLPLEEVLETQDTVEQVWQSIKMLKVRGAPALGVAGAYGLLVGLKPHVELAAADFLKKVAEVANYLDSSRPTAVNLGWALRRMVAHAGTLEGLTAVQMLSELEAEAQRIHQEDIACSHKIAQTGEPLIQEGMGVLTHCNAGHLAVSELGTALAPMYQAHSQGKQFKVYADETRPLLQGARLTAWELKKAGLDVTLICDNMAASMMAQGLIQMVIVGADRIAANGDAANKIGTLGVAILAKHFNIPFYVAAPFSTIDLNTAVGSDIEIEEREDQEVSCFAGVQTGPPGVQVRNPAFDVTDHRLITGFITDQGLIKAPFGDQLKNTFSK